MVRRLIVGALFLWACGSDDDRPDSFSYIQAAILVPNCATSGCHSKVAAVGGIDLEQPDDAYIYLVGADGNGNFVVPGQPDRSQLMYLLRGDEIWKMPPDQPLPEPDINLIER